MSSRKASHSKLKKARKSKIATKLKLKPKKIATKQIEDKESQVKAKPVILKKRTYKERQGSKLAFGVPQIKDGNRIEDKRKSKRNLKKDGPVLRREQDKAKQSFASDTAFDKKVV